MSTERQYPSSRYAWYMVVILTIAYILSFVDRYILGLLAEPIKEIGAPTVEIKLPMGIRATVKVYVIRE